MTSELLFTYAIILAIVLQLSYNHAGKSYQNGKRQNIEQSRAFSAFYLLLRLTYIPVLYLALFRGVLTFATPALVVVVGLVASFLSTAMFIYAKTLLGANYSPCYDSFAPLSLTKAGIYRYIRHPIYTANILNLLGVSLFTGSYALLLNAAILIYFYRRSAAREEKALGHLFPEYAEYQRKSGMFFPKVI